MTLHAGVLVFEDFCPEGWGYTALTRFSIRDHLYCIGDMQPWHFQTAAAVEKDGKPAADRQEDRRTRKL